MRVVAIIGFSAAVATLVAVLLLRAFRRADADRAEEWSVLHGWCSPM